MMKLPMTPESTSGLKRPKPGGNEKLNLINLNSNPHCFKAITKLTATG
jgi:hypothetical protein